MPKKQFIRLIGFFSWLSLIWQSDNFLNGDSRSLANSTNSIRTLVQLREEQGSKLPENLYLIFGNAVDFHIKGQYQLAIQEYNKLRHLVGPNGELVDLYKHSPVFEHNWKLIAPYIIQQ